MRKKTPASIRFWRYVDKSTDCWNWTGALNKASRGGGGYGVFSDDALRCVSAHHFSWELHFGQIPNGLFVLHSCDNRKCVRPEHLFLGTQLDNMRDRNAKGRAPKGDTRKHIYRGDEHWTRRRHDLLKTHGEQNGNSRLTESMVRSILDGLSHGGTSRSLARAFHVSEATISNIRNGRTWKHITQ